MGAGAEFRRSHPANHQGLTRGQPHAVIITTGICVDEAPGFIRGEGVKARIGGIAEIRQRIEKEEQPGEGLLAPDG